MNIETVFRLLSVVMITLSLTTGCQVLAQETSSSTERISLCIFKISLELTLDYRLAIGTGPEQETIETLRREVSVNQVKEVFVQPLSSLISSQTSINFIENVLSGSGQSLPKVSIIKIVHDRQSGGQDLGMYVNICGSPPSHFPDVLNERRSVKIVRFKTSGHIISVPIEYMDKSILENPPMSIWPLNRLTLHFLTLSVQNAGPLAPCPLQDHDCTVVTLLPLIFLRGQTPGSSPQSELLKPPDRVLYGGLRMWTQRKSTQPGSVVLLANTKQHGEFIARCIDHGLTQLDQWVGYFANPSQSDRNPDCSAVVSGNGLPFFVEIDPPGEMFFHGGIDIASLAARVSAVLTN